MIMPTPGDTVVLLCLKCKHSFSGPCPKQNGLGTILSKKIKRTICPKCGSKKVVMNPFVFY